MYIYERYKMRKVSSYGDGTVYSDRSRLSLEQLVEYMEAYTETHRQYELAPIAIREAEIFKVQYPGCALDAEHNDLFVGRMDVFPLGLGHQYTNSEWGFILREEWFDEKMERQDLSDDLKERIRAIRDYWAPRATINKSYDAKDQRDYLYCYNEVENGMPESSMPMSIGYDSFRVAGIYLDYEKLLHFGLAGLIEEVRRCKQASPLKDTSFYDGVAGSLQAVVNTLAWYAARLGEQCSQQTDPRRAQDLAEMARICRKLTHSAPGSFREAIQLVILYSNITGAREWGRMDDYLGDFYVRDLRGGVVDEAEALRLLESFWRLIIVREFFTDDRVVIGGRGRLHEVNADCLAMLIMETSRRVKDIVPQLTLRFYEGQNPALYDKALEVIAEGTTFPMLYNDDVIIPSIMKVFGVDEKTAEDWLPFGCGEMIINHRRINSPNVGLNLANVLLATLFGGKEPLRNWQLAPDYGNLSTFESFDELFDAYSHSVDELMELGARGQGRGYRMLAQDMSMNLVSVLYDDCLKEGKGVLHGGAQGLDGDCELYGLVTASDSLYALKKLVFDDKVISAETMMAAIKANFEGFEKERALMLGADKFGNDLKEVDGMMARVHEQACFAGLKQSGKFGMDVYNCVNINNKYNTYLGRGTGATPDGRSARDSLSNGNNPTAGMDKNGMTAFLNSLLKARTDIHAGAVQNMKFSKEVFGELRETVAKPTLKTYFDNGGAQAMINVLGRDDLKAARQNPEKYANLIVRVGGFSARYVELEEDVQMDILNRTLY